MPVPSHCQVLVVGGGPSGSYCASLLGREGFSVVLLEAAKFPRYHIGESMLPSLRPFLRYAGDELDEKMSQCGFYPKPGAAIKFQEHKKEGYTDFLSLTADGTSPAWNVVRSEFDEVLLRHASSSGVQVFEGHKVLEIQFSEGGPQQGKPVRASYQYIDENGAQDEGTISFDYLVDASGRAGIVSTKYLKNRKTNVSLKNLATWSYWRGTKRYMPGTERDNAPFFEAFADNTGWAWFIPLHDDLVSVGVVVDEKSEISKRKAVSQRLNGDNVAGTSLIKERYLEQLKSAPSLWSFLEGASLRETNDDSEANGSTETNVNGKPRPEWMKETYGVRSASDFSYAADNYAGNRYRLVGDASAFIDPFFSSGIHLALHGGLSAAATIAASIKGDCTETEAAAFHDKTVGVAYTRFLLVVMSVYKQIRNVELDILSDVDEDNFDRAFDLLRPVIQGTADIGKALTDDELQKTMDFCQHIFAPTDPSMQSAIGARLGPELLSPVAPIYSEAEADAMAKNLFGTPVTNGAAVDGKSDSQGLTMMFKKLNTVKAVNMWKDGPERVANEAINGFTVNLEKGKLGLVKVK